MCNYVRSLPCPSTPQNIDFNATYVDDLVTRPLDQKEVRLRRALAAVSSVARGTPKEPEGLQQWPANFSLIRHAALLYVMSKTVSGHMYHQAPSAAVNAFLSASTLGPPAPAPAPLLHACQWL